ncbi:MAG: AAA family ATPase [Nitrospirae bacterium]|nr:AAA family ATPase [Nitrospirota bacterium]
MAQIIAFSGKGGTGKTTLAGIAVRYLMEKTGKPVLAVDADANSCLNEALGVKVHTTIGHVREESLATIRSGARPGGMSTDEHFDYRVQQSIIESKGFDLLVMGRPEGPGCYCAANNIIRKYTDKLADDYAYVVIDNEAGMEHLSRRTAHKINVLFIVSDPTLKGIKTIGRIDGLIGELSLDIDKRYAIVNRVKDGNEARMVDPIDAALSECKLPLAGYVPEDPAIYNLDVCGKPVFGLPRDSISIKTFYEILDKVLG